MVEKRWIGDESPEELKTEYNPEGSIRRKAQLRLLDMLVYLDKICKEQNISYRLGKGNVLGAIRHGGFIPWDDDVDIVLERKDHKKLCNYLKHHSHPQYKLQTFGTDYGYVGAWATLRDLKSEYIQDSRVHTARKYRGLQVDLFSCENKVISSLYRFSAWITVYNNQLFVGRCMPIARMIHIVQYYVLHPIFRLIGLFFGDRDVYTHTYGTMLMSSHPSKTLYPCKPIMFEGLEFYGPANPSLYCEENYGSNYMVLPDKNKRNHHQASYIIND